MLKFLVGSSMPRPSGFIGANGCRERTTKPNTNSAKLKMTSASVCCFQYCGPVSRRFSKAQPARRAIFAIHQPGEGGAERNRQDDRRSQQPIQYWSSHVGAALQVSRPISSPILFPIRRRKWRYRNLPAAPCTTGPAELDTLGSRKCVCRREFRKRSIAIEAVRHKGDVRARATGRAPRWLVARRLIVSRRARFLDHNQRIVVDVNGCDELSPELGRIPSRAARAH